MPVILHMLLLSTVIYCVARLMPGVHLKNFYTSIWVAVVYSLANFLLSFMLKILLMPLILLTFGLFLLVSNLVVNTILLWITDKLIEDFEIEGLVNTLVAAVLITFSNGFLTMLLTWGV